LPNFLDFGALSFLAAYDRLFWHLLVSFAIAARHNLFLCTSSNYLPDKFVAANS
jgi:hypothetical protein